MESALVSTKSATTPANRSAVAILRSDSTSMGKKYSKSITQYPPEIYRCPLVPGQFHTKQRPIACWRLSFWMTMIMTAWQRLRPPRTLAVSIWILAVLHQRKKNKLDYSVVMYCNLKCIWINDISRMYVGEGSQMTSPIISADNVVEKIDVLRELEDIASVAITETSFFCK